MATDKPESRETRLHASEVKFLVGPALAAEIERWASRWLAPDPHGERYRVSSLYFDTAGRDVYERRGSYGRGKYRIRRYDDAGTAFLERKLRARQVVVKRRSLVDLHELPLLEAGAPDRGWHPGFWFHRRLRARDLSPAWQVSYLRTARMLETKVGAIRLTLDRDLSALPAASFAFSEEPGVPVFNDGSCVLELKFRNRMPELFDDLVRELALAPQPLSKFRLAAKAHGYA